MVRYLDVLCYWFFCAKLTSNGETRLLSGCPDNWQLKSHGHRPLRSHGELATLVSSLANNSISNHTFSFRADTHSAQVFRSHADGRFASQSDMNLERVSHRWGRGLTKGILPLRAAVPDLLSSNVWADCCWEVFFMKRRGTLAQMTLTVYLQRYDVLPTVWRSDGVTRFSHRLLGETLLCTFSGPQNRGSKSGS